MWTQGCYRILIFTLFLILGKMILQSKRVIFSDPLERQCLIIVETPFCLLPEVKSNVDHVHSFCVSLFNTNEASNCLNKLHLTSILIRSFFILSLLICLLYVLVLFFFAVKPSLYTYSFPFPCFRTIQVY